jgi:ATP-dependent RNA helicase DDX55/SPB4
MHELDISDCLDAEKFDAELSRIHKLQLKDRGVFDKAVRAFVSYFKAYSKYECKLILRLKGSILK